MAQIIDIEVIGPAYAKKLVRQVPSLDQVPSWIAQAADLPRVVSH